MRYRCVLDTRYHRYWYNYLNLTIVDNVFDVHVLHNFWLFFMGFLASLIVLLFLVGSHGFSRFLHVPFTCLPASIMQFYQSIRTDVFEVHWQSFAIIPDGRQPSVQQCAVCDVSFKSILNYSCTSDFHIICVSCSIDNIWNPVKFSLIICMNYQVDQKAISANIDNWGCKKRHLLFAN